MVMWAADEELEEFVAWIAAAGHRACDHVAESPF
jgi:hypothetical protein